MNSWVLASFAFLLALVPCAVLCFTSRDVMIRLVGLEMAGAIETLFMLCFAEALGRPEFYDLAIAMALLAFGSGLVFVRFLERWE